jgi:hypothetical protein
VLFSVELYIINKDIDQLVRVQWLLQELENYSIPNAAESNWASVAGMVPTVELGI